MTADFFDTNILVYAYDSSEVQLHEVCKRLITQVFNGERIGCVSNQVLAEFFHVATRKMEHPISPQSACVVIDALAGSSNWQKIDYTQRTVAAAGHLSRDNRSPFWDALLAQTCLEHGLKRIVTNNPKDFNNLPGLVTVSPLALAHEMPNQK